MASFNQVISLFYLYVLFPLCGKQGRKLKNMSNLESRKCTQLQFSFLSELYLFIAIFFVPVCYLFVFSAFLCLSATLALCLFSFIFSQFSLSVCYSILSQISFLYLSYISQQLTPLVEGPARSPRSPASAVCQPTTPTHYLPVPV